MYWEDIGIAGKVGSINYDPLSKFGYYMNCTKHCLMSYYRYYVLAVFLVVFYHFTWDSYWRVEMTDS